jgi:transcriptional regulator with XRE-family HTH domain
MQEDSAGILIARARQLRRMSQVQLADHLGVSPSTVANWERGEHYPLRFVHVIEEALGITLPARPKAKATT